MQDTWKDEGRRPPTLSSYPKDRDGVEHTDPKGPRTLRTGLPDVLLGTIKLLGISQGIGGGVGGGGS